MHQHLQINNFEYAKQKKTWVMPLILAKYISTYNFINEKRLKEITKFRQSIDDMKTSLG
jgi:hypothetical protein